MEYLGNCVDSFDLDGDCINDALPWNTVSDFALAVEEGDNILVNDINVIYDSETDIHSFFRVG